MANHVKPRRKYLKLTQQAIADAIGTTKATVMKLEKGDMQLTENWLKRLAGPLQCNPQDLIAEEWPQDVPLIGEVYGKGAIRLYKELPQEGAAEMDAQWWEGIESAPRPPEGEYREVMALKVADDAMEPLLPAGSLVYYAEPIKKGFDAYFGQLVVCEVEEDASIHIARLQRGYSYGACNLIKPNSAPLDDVVIKWCAKVIFLKPL